MYIDVVHNNQGLQHYLHALIYMLLYIRDCCNYACVTHVDAFLQHQRFVATLGGHASFEPNVLASCMVASSQNILFEYTSTICACIHIYIINTLHIVFHPV